MHYTVYKTTNTLNGKVYIGVHATEDPNDRYLGSGKLISKAIRKYGRTSFKKEVLFDFDTPDEMMRKEAELVDAAFVGREDTYNLVPGGVHGDTFYEARKQIPEEVFRKGGLKGGAAWAKRLRNEPETRAALAEKVSAQTRALNLQKSAEGDTAFFATFTGRTHSEETRKKMRGPRAVSRGEGNSQYGTVWVCREGVNPQKIPKTDLPRFLKAGWQRGRKVR